MSEKMKLSSQKLRAITLLVSGKNQRDTAKEIGINERTLSRWLDQPDFHFTLRKGQEKAFKEGERLMSGAVKIAIEQLISILQDSDSSAAARVSCCRILLDSALKYRQNLELEDRILELECKFQR